MRKGMLPTIAIMRKKMTIQEILMTANMIASESLEVICKYNYFNDSDYYD